jgi:hypothetical protein
MDKRFARAALFLATGLAAREARAQKIAIDAIGTDHRA